jgi:hypothetical protein
MYKFLKRPYTLAGFEPGIFCSVGGRDDHYTTPPGHQNGFTISCQARLFATDKYFSII